MVKRKSKLIKCAGILVILFISTKVSGQIYVPVKSGEKYGYHDTSGSQVIGPSFTAAKIFREGMGAVSVHPENGRKWFYINSKRSIVIKTGFIEAMPFYGGKARIYNGREWMFIDTAGNKAVEYVFEEAEDFVGGYAKVKKAGKGWGIIDSTGNYVVEPVLAACTNANYSVYGAYNPSKKHWAYLNLSGDTAIQQLFEDAGSFNDSLAPVKLNNIWAYINLKGKQEIPYQFDEAGPFYYGLAAVKKNGRWYFINKTGNPAFKHSFKTIGDFKAGVAEVVLEDGTAAYLTQGGTIIK